MSETLDRQLERLNAQFEAMGLNVSKQIAEATQAFLTGSGQQALAVIRRDQGINDDAVALEKMIIQTLALQQPVASDFRTVMSILKSATDLERIGDHAVGIAREAKATPITERLTDVDQTVATMTARVTTMLEAILHAYVTDDVEQARSVAADDLHVDHVFMQIRRGTTQAVEADASRAAVSASYLFVARLLERIGDHVVNIAEWIVYNHTGHLVELNLGKADRRRAERLEEG